MGIMPGAQAAGRLMFGAVMALGGRGARREFDDDATRAHLARDHLLHSTAQNKARPGRAKRAETACL